MRLAGDQPQAYYPLPFFDHHAVFGNVLALSQTPHEPDLVFFELVLAEPSAPLH